MLCAVELVAEHWIAHCVITNEINPATDYCLKAM